MMMGIIEAKLSPNHSTKHHIYHVNGAAALVELRGPEQLTTPVGAAMYMEVSAYLCISRVLTRTPVPQFFQDMHQESAKYVTDSQDTHWRWLEL